MSAGRTLAGRVEAHVRKAWNERPGRTLRLASSGFAAAAGVRNLLYDSGVLASRRAPLPVVSVGGLTIGGSGKTPIAADIGARLVNAGVPTAIVTHGFEDEIDVHRKLSPDVQVYGGRDRMRWIHEAATHGARIVVLDSGFQHRRIHRDLDIVTLDEAAVGFMTAYLPAGPYRESMDSLARADLVVTVRRQLPGEETTDDATVHPTGSIRSWLRELADVDGAPPFVSARIQPGRLLAVNRAAEETAEPCPVVAVAGVMWPQVFFTQVRRGSPSVRETVGLSDHARFDAALGKRLRTMAGDSGIVCTLKDAAKLVRALGDTVPLWYLSEKVSWEQPEPEPAAIKAALALVPSTDIAVT